MVRVACDDSRKVQDLINASKFIIVEIGKILVYSNVIHFFLKSLLQPSVVSQYIAGMIVGNSMTKYALKIEQDMTSLKDLLDQITLFGSYLFMFLTGLEMDLVYLRLSLRRSAYVAFAGMVTCTALLATTVPFLYRRLGNKEASLFLFFVTFALFVSNTASPVLIRIVTELKLTSSNIGRLAITSGFVSDLTTVLAFAVYSIVKMTNVTVTVSIQATYVLGIIFVILIGMIGFPWVARALNQIHKNKRYIGNIIMVIFIGLILVIGWTSDYVGFNGTALCFLIGIMIPREGPTTRTMLDILQYPVHNILLPLYFTHTASKTELSALAGMDGGMLFGIALLVTVIGTFGKVVGTVVVTSRFLKIPTKEGLVLGMLLNVKGHLDVMLLQMGEDLMLWDKKANIVMILTILISTLIAGPVSSLIVWWERRSYTYQAQSLENIGPDSQLRVLACVHCPREVTPMLSLVALCKGDGVSLMAVYLQHLIELTQKYTVTLMYHQKSPGSSDSDYGSDIVRQVNVVVDMVTKDIGVPVREMTAISHYVNMHTDVCMGAEDVRATFIILPFHKEQRTRPSATNSTIATDLETTPATPTGVQIPLSKVVAIFFGGPDDREAATVMLRMATHPLVEATLVRFLPEIRDDAHSKSGTSSRFTSQIAMIVEDDTEAEADDEFISNYKKSYVETGIVMFEERYVRNGSETVTALSSMAGLYSLFIVGKGRSNPSPLMSGISDWEECPELGPIGDLLASEDFMDSGSVLIIHQHSLTERRSLLGGEDYR
ncbi:hypothetical protein LUZ60_007085 [Juncus effusus]|nr:hypothetical protein LUZ60_007085 [Juncus effusus]